MEFHEWYILLGFPELQLKKKNLCHSYFDINAKKKKTSVLHCSRCNYFFSNAVYQIKVQMMRLALTLSLQVQVNWICGINFRILKFCFVSL